MIEQICMFYLHTFHLFIHPYPHISLGEQLSIKEKIDQILNYSIKAYTNPWLIECTIYQHTLIEQSCFNWHFTFHCMYGIS